VGDQIDIDFASLLKLYEGNGRDENSLIRKNHTMERE
jgi:hypothetical protein